MKRLEEIKSGTTFLQDNATVSFIDTKEGLQEAISKLLSAKIIGLDIETAKLSDHQHAGLIPCISRVRLVQVYDGNTCYVIDINKLGLDWLKKLQHKQMVAHNAQFEDTHLYHAGIDLMNLQCSLLVGRVFVGEHGLSLSDLSRKALGVDVDKELQISDWSADNLTDAQIAYAALDAVLTYHLWFQYKKLFQCPEATHYRGTYEFLRSLLRSTTKQLLQGLVVDVDAHKNIIKQWQTSLETAIADLSSLGLVQAPESNKERIALKKLGTRFLSSSKDKQSVLRERLTEDELVSWPLTKSGGLKTDLGALSALEHYPELQSLGKYSALSSKLANYGNKLSELMIDGKIYPSYRIAGMVTGRFSCTKPNLQNQPRSGFKHIYKPPEGHVFVGADLAQVELRVAGLLSQDEVINQCYADGVDLHANMAADIRARMSDEKYQEELDKFDGNEAKLFKHLRQGAKGVNFGLLYGSGAKGLQTYCKATYGVELSIEEAEDYKNLFREKYAGLTRWQKLIVAHSQEHGEVESPYSRLTRHFEEKDYFRGVFRAEPYSICMNFPVQSGAWEILALAIIYIDKLAPEDVKISHHVYDELVLTCPYTLKEETAQLLYDGFAHGYKKVFPDCSVKGICEVSWGETWAELSNPDNGVMINES